MLKENLYPEIYMLSPLHFKDILGISRKMRETSPCENLRSVARSRYERNVTLKGKASGLAESDPH